MMVDVLFEAENIYCYPMSCDDLVILLRNMGWREVRHGIWTPPTSTAAPDACAMLKTAIRMRSKGVVRGEGRLLLDFPVFRRRPDLGINAWEID
ncbi:hypothetical protein [Geminicoccus harenae]|uniref:hypothetical protein n=1 Tax=Geminicoccus harenae TaxID=2498453 RepID=UPI00168ACADB|nr:hypothetical protein [Geminicoccus harenae]